MWVNGRLQSGRHRSASLLQRVPADLSDGGAGERVEGRAVVSEGGTVPACFSGQAG